MPNKAPFDASLLSDYRKTTYSLKERGARVYDTSQIKPVSYFKSNAAKVLAQLSERRQPLVITQHGEAKAVLQDVASYEESQETLALLKILALGERDVEAGRVKPVADVVARLRMGPEPR
ncbi:MAG TPA: type II toxin-antitoxin system Phd/YefM family antitoxin [Nevskiaceae bacterium]|nr:type II toxin-antitoxin system Phd/YefM family antitoxin [Nevskiaceae bacterium]